MPPSAELPAVPRTLTRYKTVMRFHGVLYLLVGLMFFFFPNAVFYLLNVGPKVFNALTPIPDSTERFWLVLTTSMMAMLSALSFLAAENPSVNGYPLVHILSKVISVCGFIYCYVYHAPYFAYLVGVITDLPIAVVVTWCWLRLPRKYLSARAQALAASIPAMPAPEGEPAPEGGLSLESGPSVGSATDSPAGKGEQVP